ncbi:MAG TPA: hypothetical protein VFJ95_03870, partial [Gammaproteobacteria bacterium]|nr:hypothetical protein [Gammaproteobacteria bacterium]
MRSILRLVLLLVVAAGVIAAHAQDRGAYRGRSVASVIDQLRADGLPLVYSSNLLPSTLLVEKEPESTEPLAVAREILAPHGLALREQGGVWLVVRGAPPPAPLPASVTVT